MFAVVLSILAYDYYFIESGQFGFRNAQGHPAHNPFAVAGAFVVWLTAAQRSATKSLRRARDDLEAAFQDLARLNKSLEVENAERKRAEQQLRQSKAYLDEAQRLSQTGSFAWRIANDEIVWSKETYQIFGCRSDGNADDRHHPRAHSPDDRALIQSQIDRAVSGERDFDYEHRLLAPDGSIKQLHVRASRVKYETGEEEIVARWLTSPPPERAEEALNKAQTELAHVTRVTTFRRDERVDSP